MHAARTALWHTNICIIHHHIYIYIYIYAYIREHATVTRGHSDGPLPHECMHNPHIHTHTYIYNCVYAYMQWRLGALRRPSESRRLRGRGDQGSNPRYRLRRHVLGSCWRGNHMCAHVSTCMAWVQIRDVACVGVCTR
jgi:hypothetical protein